MTQYFSAQYRVYYEDTDAAGVVYYANYLKYAERARSDYLRHVFQAPSMIAEKFGLMFVVRQCYIDYLRPARLDDALDILTRIIAIKSATIEMEQQIMRQENKLTEIRVVLACVDCQKFQPSRIPQALKSKLITGAKS